MASLLSKENVRPASRWIWLGHLAQDSRYGSRASRRSPMFSALVVLSLALGIGANAAIYSVMDAILFRALPVQRPRELAILNWRAIKPPATGFTEPAGIKGVDGSVYTGPGGDRLSPDFPWPFYASIRDGNDVFSTVFAYKDAGQLAMSIQGHAELGAVEFVSGNFFRALGVGSAHGRLISESDNLANAPSVAVLSYAFWRDRFAGDPAVVGRTIKVGRDLFTICGVAAPEFFGIQPGSAPVLYIPIATRPSVTSDSIATAEQKRSMFIDPHYYWVDLMGRLRPGVTLAHAATVTAARFRQFALGAGADNSRGDLPVLWLDEGGSGLDSLRRRYSKPLLVLMTMVSFILAIACANIANLLLARAAFRRREIAVRLSLGAGRARIIRQLLTESVLLALPGGILGLAVAALGTRFLLGLLGGGAPDFQLHAPLDWSIFAFTIAVSLGTGILCGLAPAIEATRAAISPALKGTAADQYRSRRIGPSQLLVTAQIALSLLLVFGAVLFVRTLLNLHALDLGFNAENLLTFNLNASKAGYTQAALTNFYTCIEERLSAVPGVRAVTATASPIAAGSYGTPVLLPGGQKGSAGWDSVGSSFFETMQVPIVVGRALDTRDREGAPPTAVVNQAFARKYFPGRSPVGEHIGILDGMKDVTIVGVAGNFIRSLKAGVSPFIYISYRQFPAPSWRGMFYEIRTDGNPALTASIQRILREAAPDVPAANMMTQSQRTESSLAQEHTFANLCAAFAVLALTIACVGLYGSTAYAISRRTNEIGIRMALGAPRLRVTWMVMREVLILSAAGIAIGLLCARGILPAVKSFLFGVRAGDPLVILEAAGLLIASSLLAGYLPACRASRIDPLVAIRHE